MKLSDLLEGHTVESDWADSRVKNVMCITTGEKYKSLSDASRATGINRKLISKACSGSTELAGGMRWCFLDVRQY